MCRDGDGRGGVVAPGLGEFVNEGVADGVGVGLVAWCTDDGEAAAGEFLAMAGVREFADVDGVFDGGADGLGVAGIGRVGGNGFEDGAPGEKGQNGEDGAGFFHGDLFCW